ncbi:MAG: phosphate transport system regulatory protein PhoU [Candidatus Melainabacteria bacterium RIFCSPHIGHO2_02_FULL_34_12]|nr:MAG: phosphate transport system regulatory protein PhoU [Candidatus Melainabacteria bacterium RIFCSPHIGHO2_02_FULL_34_12]
MTQTVRITFQDELVKLQQLVLDLAENVKANGELLFEFLQNKENVNELFLKIKNKDKEIDKARWQVHDFGDALIVLQQPVAKDFRQIMVSMQVTDNLERIGDHFKKTARLLEKVTLSDIEVPQEIINMAKLGNKMLSESIDAYRDMFGEKTNEIAEMDDQVDTIYKLAISKIINLIKGAPESKVDSLSKLFFIAQSFERAADHAAKIGLLVNYAITGKRKK